MLKIDAFMINEKDWSVVSCLEPCLIVVGSREGRQWIVLIV